MLLNFTSLIKRKKKQSIHKIEWVVAIKYRCCGHMVYRRASRDDNAFWCCNFKVQTWRYSSSYQEYFITYLTACQQTNSACHGSWIKVPHQPCSKGLSFFFYTRSVQRVLSINSERQLFSFKSKVHTLNNLSFLDTYKSKLTIF